MSVKDNFPTTRPSLLLDFANTKVLDPRITFSRASTATFYDGKTVAKAEENLLLYSQEFEQSQWTKSGVTVTANSTTAPDGTMTGDKLIAGVNSSSKNVFQAISGSSFAISIFAKAGEYSFLRISSGTAANSVCFDLSNGTIGTVKGTVANYSITNEGNNWYRCTVIYQGNSSGFASFMGGATDDFAVAYIGDGTSGIFIWGAQAEIRSTVTAYTPTTTQPITNYIPVLQTAAANVARFDHNPVTGESLGLRVEEQRTNLLTYSEMFDNGSWIKSSTTVTPDAIIAPDGTLTGDKIREVAALAGHSVYQNLSVTSGTTYTLSCFFKKGERGFGWLKFSDDVTNWGRCFNLTTGQVGNVVSGFTAPTTSAITDVGNGWYRCAITMTAANTATGGHDIGVMSTDGTRVYTGDGYSGIYIWGAQLEAGSFATSYIPTVASQVTRSADSASMTGTNFSSWYRADEGTLYGEVSARSGLTFGRIADLTATDGNVGSIRAYYDTTVSPTRIGWTTSINNAKDFNVIPAVSVGETTARFAGAYANNSAQAAVNGIAGTEDTSCRVAQGINQLILGASVTGANRINGHIRKLSYYPIRLTNLQLQALTQQG